jgi:hypothetical protein
MQAVYSLTVVEMGEIHVPDQVPRSPNTFDPHHPRVDIRDNWKEEIAVSPHDTIQI